MIDQVIILDGLKAKLQGKYAELDSTTKDVEIINDFNQWMLLNDTLAEHIIQSLNTKNEDTVVFSREQISAIQLLWDISMTAIRVRPKMNQIDPKKEAFVSSAIAMVIVLVAKASILFPDIDFSSFSGVRESCMMLISSVCKDPTEEETE